MKLLTLALFVFVSVFNIRPAYAVPKTKVCKPYQTEVCVEKKTIPQKFRSKLPATTKFYTPLRRYPITSGSLTDFLNIPSGTPEPQILVPAGVHTTTVCRILNGKLDCALLSAYNACPASITIQDQDSGVMYTCDIDCDNRRPNGDADSNGNCDCDVKYDTCRQGFN